ncbi:PleD family two-component system response regulator [Nibricoccus sp. IMCC34717]|uniref:response regulator n=1 Tax=Nibricoccus sp. IMCC34717 TaxID=3034021 RepID=UPI00384CF5C7
MKVLAVEDDPVAKVALEGALSALGLEVVPASDGEEAWELLKRGDIRIVVCDWRMPKLDGLQLCRRVRGQQGAEYVYFILLSSVEHSDANQDLALRAGVDDFLSKPVRLQELKVRLHVAQRILKFATQVRQLEAFLPICSYCKKIRDDKNYWDRIESYIGTRTGSEFSHSVCPDCYQQHLVPQLEALGSHPPYHPEARQVRPPDRPASGS